jgi:hypothetical protein
MAFAYSTITAAVGATDTSFSLTVGTGVTASIFQAATNPAVGAQTYLLIDQEMCQVISGTFGSGVSPVNVKRGVMGTRAMPHPALTNFIFGTSVDFLGFVPAISELRLTQPDVGFQSAGPVVASAASIIAPSSLFHVSGVTNITNMQPPTSALLSQSGPNSEENYVNGTRVTIIFDSTALVTTGGGGTGPAFAAATLAATAGTFCDFILDTSSGAALWYPSRHAS